MLLPNFPRRNQAIYKSIRHAQTDKQSFYHLNFCCHLVSIFQRSLTPVNSTSVKNDVTPERSYAPTSIVLTSTHDCIDILKVSKHDYSDFKFTLLASNVSVILFVCRIALESSTRCTWRTWMWRWSLSLEIFLVVFTFLLPVIERNLCRLRFNKSFCVCCVFFIF